MIARHALAFIHIGASPLQPDHKTPQDKYHGRLVRSSDRHSHFFRNHNFCLPAALGASPGVAMDAALLLLMLDAAHAELVSHQPEAQHPKSSAAARQIN